MTTTDDETAPENSAGSPSEEVDRLAPDAGELSRVRDEMARVLAAAKVKRVVVVDDDFEAGVDDLLDALRDLDRADRVRVSHLEGLRFPARGWERAVRLRWDDLSPSEQAVCVSDARARSGAQPMHHQPNAGALASMLPEDVEFLALGFEAWTESRDQILEAASTLPTVALFDRNFGDRRDVGIGLIQHALAATSDVRAGLLTNTVERSQEFDEWRTIRDQADLNGERFIVISKQNLASEPSMPQAMKVALLTHSLAHLSAGLEAVVDDAVEDARSHLAEISPWEFERIVFGASLQEGVWEPDTLLRIFNVHFQRSARRGMRGVSGIHESVRHARALAAVELSDFSETTEMASAIHELELYEELEFINSQMLPIELGDVFVKANGNVQYVLVDQQCDLMVRPEGKRQPNLDYVELLPIKTAPTALDRGDTFELKYFPPARTSAWVQLGRAERVPVEALDLCALNPKGESQLVIGEHPPIELSAPWVRRHERLQAWAKKTVAKVDAANDASKTDVRTANLKTFDGCLVKGSVFSSGERTGVKYNLRRTARLRPPATFALLTAFHAHRARMAYEGPLMPRGSSERGVAEQAAS